MIESILLANRISEYSTIKKSSGKMLINRAVNRIDEMIEKISTDVLRSVSPLRAAPEYSGGIVNRQKIMGSWSCDIYKHRQDFDLYVRLFQGRKKVAEVPITQAVRVLSGSFLLSLGVPSGDIPQILNGIRIILSSKLLISSKLIPQEEKRKKEPRYRVDPAVKYV